MIEKIFFLMCVAGGFFGINAAAQKSPSLKVNLFAVQTIEVNGNGGSALELNYETQEDYKNGVSVSKKDHLKIYSTGGFVITVKSMTPTLISSLNNGASIEVGDITMTASPGSATVLQGLVTNPIQLSTIDTTIISSNVGGINKTYNITYRSKGDQDVYLNKFISGQIPTVYTTQVVYSIAPQ